MIGRAELLFPVPDKWRSQHPHQRVFRHGQRVLAGRRHPFVGIDGVTPVDYEFDYNELKQSAGLAVQWLAPLGVFRFSYAFPLNEFKGDGVRYPRRGREIPVHDRFRILTSEAR